MSTPTGFKRELLIAIACGALMLAVGAGCAYLQELGEDVVSAGGEALIETAGETIAAGPDGWAEDSAEFGGGFAAGLAGRYLGKFLPILLARRRRRKE